MRDMQGEAERVRELIEILDRLAMGLGMVVGQFNREIERLRTGEEVVRGNDGVELGKRVRNAKA